MYTKLNKTFQYWQLSGFPAFHLDLPVADKTMVLADVYRHACLQLLMKKRFISYILPV